MKSARLNLTIPEDLKQQMDTIGEPVNWSAVACQAFRAKIAEIITRRGAKTMEETIMRLKASKAKSSNAKFVAGREAGIKWARQLAEASHLERLGDHDDLSYVFDDLPRNPPACILLMSIIFDEAERDGRSGYQLAQEFWTSIPGIETAQPDTETCRGFVNGAETVWDEVADHL